MKNKILTLLLCGAMAFSLAACSVNINIGGSDTGTESETEQVKEVSDEEADLEDTEQTGSVDRTEATEEQSGDTESVTKTDETAWLQDLYTALKDGNDLDYSFSVIESDNYIDTVKEYGESSGMTDTTAVFEVSGDYVILYYYAPMSSYDYGIRMAAVVDGSSYTEGMDVSELETITNMSMVELLEYETPTRVAMVNGTAYYEIDGEMVAYDLGDIYSEYGDYITEDGDFSFSYDGSGTIVDYTTGEDVTIDFGN